MSTVGTMPLIRGPHCAACPTTGCVRQGNARSGRTRRSSKRLNNRAANSHRPTRQRERALRRFTPADHAQRFLATFGAIREHLCPRRHRLKVAVYRQERAQRFLVWNEVTGVAMAA